jgi:hypothetical protein
MPVMHMEEGQMRKIWNVGWMLAASLAAMPAFADAGALAGTWTGPWYIGMSSGMATLEVAPDGSGSIALTNLEDFGAQPVPLSKVALEADAISFSAAGEGGAVLTMKLKRDAGGQQMRGNGKYAGFGARLEVKRAE